MTVKGPRGGEHANEAQMKMRQIWRTKAWRERRKELLALYPHCEWCGAIAQVINHKREGYYPGYELCKREEIDIICNRCHKDWTEKGIKNTRAMHACTGCGYPAYEGKTKCFFCGEAIKKTANHSPERMKLFSEIMRRCPEVRNGDVWFDVWLWSKEEVTVTGWKEQDMLPWPLIVTDRGEVGLPAFTFGQLRTRGEGPGWRQGLAPAAPTSERKASTLSPVRA
jgi:hypothetical protein